MLRLARRRGHLFGIFITGLEAELARIDKMLDDANER